MHTVNEPLELALLYHLNSPVPKSYVKRVPATELRYLPEDPFLELPPAPRDNPLSELLARRSSVRSFENQVMPFVLFRYINPHRLLSATTGCRVWTQWTA